MNAHKHGKRERNNIKAKDGERRCGAYIIDTRNGDIVHWIRFEGAVRELFDAAFVPGVRAPMCVGLGNPRYPRSSLRQRSVGIDRGGRGLIENLAEDAIEIGVARAFAVVRLERARLGSGRLLRRLFPS
jgi:hypothetical protein